MMAADDMFPDPLAELRYALAESDAVAPPVGVLDRVMAAAAEARPAGRSVHAGPRISPAEAHRRTTAALTDLLTTLAPDDWHRPALRDLDVQGLVGHLIGVERHLQDAFPGSGGTAPDDHIASTQPFADAQTGRAPAETLDEWKAVVAAAQAVIDAGDRDTMATPMTMHGMTLPVSAMLTVRAFETWTHEEDIRRAVGLPLAPPDASTLSLMTNLAIMLVPIGMARAGRPGPGRTGRLVLTGIGGGTWTQALGSEPAGTPDVRVVADAVEFCRLVADRISPDAFSAVITGDEQLAGDIFAGANALALD